MSNRLEEAALNAASIRRDNPIGTIFLDRTIWHAVEVTDGEGRVILDAKGDPLVEPRIYRIAGSHLTQDALDTALQLEKEFPVLNQKMRESEERAGYKWKLNKPRSILIDDGLFG